MQKFFPLHIIFLILLLSVINYFHQEIYTFLPILPAWSFIAFNAAGILSLLLFIDIDKSSLDGLQYDFINVVTHTFRTPTTVIKWSLDGLRQSPLAKDIVDETNQIESANTRMIELLDILTGYTSTITDTAYNFKAESFREMVEQMIAKFGPKMRQKNISLLLDLPQDLPLVTADTKRFQFVLEVLFQNAVMYTPNGGHITISIHRNNKHLLFSIKDTGIGLTWKERQHVFKQFFRGHQAMVTDTQGLGLGLYIAKKIVTRHKGKMWVESAGKDKGANFLIELPLLY